MKFLIELNPSAETKNEFEKSPEKQKKFQEFMQNLRPLAAWFSYRFGFLVVEANSNEELVKAIFPLDHLFKTDVKVSPVLSMEDFAKVLPLVGEIAQKY